jgi:crotonobetainyl-CoA:carnitine CoA-transferase CaiB-like acyl-CoA transferase
MPCESGYLAADGYEIRMSQVACLLDELEGKPINQGHWAGYHPRVYCRAVIIEGDKIVQELCDRLQKLDVTKYSLEMQIWWRDHQVADKERLEREIQKAVELKARQEAIAKLTPYERGLLGITDAS